MVRACKPVFQNLPHSYLAFEKTDPFIYLIVQNVDLFIYCPCIFFYTHLLMVVRQISQSIHWITREQANSKKRGLIIYLAMLKKGPFGMHICTVQNIGSYSLPLRPTHHSPLEGLLHLWIWIHILLQTVVLVINQNLNDPDIRQLTHPLAVWSGLRLYMQTEY